VHLGDVSLQPGERVPDRTIELVHGARGVYGYARPARVLRRRVRAARL